MRRREFIAALGSAVAMLLAARAQERVRRLAVLMSNVEGDVEQKARISAFLEILEKAGWIEGRNLRIDYRFGATDAARIRISATELAGLAPDVAFVSNQPLLEAMRQASGATQIVFLGVTDPLDQGLVASLASRRQHHRLHARRVLYWRKVARTTQGDRTEYQARGSLDDTN